MLVKEKIDSNSYYHIYNRGNNKELIFFEDDNYLYFLKQFKHYLLPSCDVYAYCLMPNHFHFFIKVKDKINFEKSIKNFFISYSKSINKKHNRVGSLFQGRYKASEIKTHDYYTAVIAYIHQNPVKAKLSKTLEEYRYSSYSSYLSSKQSMLYRQDVIDWFGGIKEFVEYHKISLDNKKIEKLFV